MKFECWLKPNRRAMGFALILPVFLAIIALVLLLFVPRQGIGEVVYWFSWALFVGSFVGFGSIFFLLRTPRLAYKDGRLLVYLRGMAPERVPIESVECFFLGQGPSYLPQTGEKPSEVNTIVVRLADAALEWKRIETNPTLGHWCDGYITIRGTWCEPITPLLMKNLNERLAAIHREQRTQKHQETA